MLKKNEKDKIELQKSIAVLKAAVKSKQERKEILLRGEKITPRISKEISDINFTIDKKQKQIQKAERKLADLWV